MGLHHKSSGKGKGGSGEPGKDSISPESLQKSLRSYPRIKRIYSDTADRIFAAYCADETFKIARLMRDAIRLHSEHHGSWAFEKCLTESADEFDSLRPILPVLVQALDEGSFQMEEWIDALLCGLDEKEYPWTLKPPSKTGSVNSTGSSTSERNPRSSDGKKWLQT